MLCGRCVFRSVTTRGASLKLWNSDPSVTTTTHSAMYTIVHTTMHNTTHTIAHSNSYSRKSDLSGLSGQVGAKVGCQFKACNIPLRSPCMDKGVGVAKFHPVSHHIMWHPVPLVVKSPFVWTLFVYMSAYWESTSMNFVEPKKPTR